MLLLHYILKVFLRNNLKCILIILKHGRWYHFLSGGNPRVQTLSGINPQVEFIRIIIFIDFPACIFEIILRCWLLTYIIVPSGCDPGSSIICFDYFPFFKEILKRIGDLWFFKRHILLAVLSCGNDEVRVRIVFLVVLEIGTVIVFTLSFTQLWLNDLLFFILRKILLLRTIFDLGSPIRYNLIFPVRRIPSGTIRYRPLRLNVRHA